MMLILRAIFSFIVKEIMPSITGLPVIITSLVIAVYVYGHIHGTDACQNAEKAAIIKQEAKNDKIEQKIDGLSPDALDKRLRPYYRD